MTVHALQSSIAAIEAVLYFHSLVMKEVHVSKVMYAAVCLGDGNAEQGTRLDMEDRGSLERWSLMVQMSARMAGVGGCSSRPRSHL